MLTRSLTWSGQTQPQGDPGSVYVKGSEHVSDIQSKDQLGKKINTHISDNLGGIIEEKESIVPLLGGGDGRTKAYAAGGVLVFFTDEPRGEILGEV